MNEDASGVARCKHFGRCGSCDLLDWTYGRELEEKLNWLEESLGDRVTSIEPIRLADSPLDYRTTLRAPFANTNERVVVLGFYRRDSHQVVNVRECRIQHPALVELLKQTREIAREVGASAYNERTGRGLLRHLAGRVSSDGRVLAGLVVRRGGEKKTQQIARRLADEWGDRLVGVIENVQPKSTNRIFGRQSRVLIGEGVLEESWDGLSLKTGLISFTQTHWAQAKVLFELAISELDLPESAEAPVVGDIFSGWSPIGLRLAQQGYRVVAVESNATSVREGVANAEENGLTERLTYQQVDAGEGITALLKEGVRHFVVDPPRAGLGPEVITALHETPAERLVYISCHPESLARDLDQLKATYHCTRVTPVDLFPKIQHLESVALLEPRR